MKRAGYPVQPYLKHKILLHITTIKFRQDRAKDAAFYTSTRYSLPKRKKYFLFFPCSVADILHIVFLRPYLNLNQTKIMISML